MFGRRRASRGLHCPNGGGLRLPAGGWYAPYRRRPRGLHGALLHGQGGACAAGWSPGPRHGAPGLGGGLFLGVCLSDVPGRPSTVLLGRQDSAPTG
eukprot:11445693-Alexandrium_andersonii.AAC.1